jgi:hypothetical protein
MGSIDAAIEVQEVFNKICPFTYNFFETKVDHEWAIKNRYASGDIETDLKRILES